eukprot:9489609-Pyramimonas_sp.AAC.1
MLDGMDGQARQSAKVPTQTGPCDGRLLSGCPTSVSTPTSTNCKCMSGMLGGALNQSATLGGSAT